MNREEIKEILERFKDGRAGESDRAFLESWYNHFSERELEQLSAVERVAAVDLAWDAILAMIEQKELELIGDKGKVVKMDKKDNSRAIFQWKKWMSAAAIITVLVGVGLYKYLSTGVQPGLESYYANDVMPGKQGATLTLASGKQIQLTNAANGELAQESGVTITKTATGELIYQINDQTQASQNIINTLNTAKGETYQVVLPDGSKVWLNAATTLTYPSKFTLLNQRKVQLDGEAYFEIAKDKAHPFIVASGNQEITVLGTHFNINNYKDEQSAKTTLLEGSVKITSISNKTEKLLKPGEQASLNNRGDLKIAEVITSDAIAWKNGKFVFDDESIESIMQKLARWYNIEVIYDGENVKQIPFTGSISRYDNISKILDKISYTQNIHFKIEGRRVTVMK